MNIFYQLIGFGALIAMGLSYWQNDKRTILLWQVVANLIFAIHYTLLHARSGALCSFFQIVVLLLFLLQEKFNWSKLVTAIPIVAVFLLIAVVTYETPVTVLPIVASLAALLPFFQSRRRVIQAAGIVSGLSEGCTASGVVLQTLRHRRGCAAAGVAGERVAFLSAAPGGCCQRGQPPLAGD